MTDELTPAELRRLHAENERKSEAIQKLWKERDEAIAENERLRAAVLRYVTLIDDSRRMGTPPHSDYWVQPFMEAEATMRATLKEQQ